MTVATIVASAAGITLVCAGALLAGTPAAAAVGAAYVLAALAGMAWPRLPGVTAMVSVGFVIQAASASRLGVLTALVEVLLLGTYLGVSELYGTGLSADLGRRAWQAHLLPLAIAVLTAGLLAGMATARSAVGASAGLTLAAASGSAVLVLAVGLPTRRRKTIAPTRPARDGGKDGTGSRSSS